MVRGVRLLSVNEAPRRRPPDRSSGSTGCFGDGADEVPPICAGTLFRLGVAGARTLDYAWQFDWSPAQRTTCNGKNRPGKKPMTATRRLTLALLLILSTFALAADLGQSEATILVDPRLPS